MKKLIAAAVFGIAALTAFAGTCTITHISLVNTDGSHKTFGAQLDNNSGVNILQHNFLVTFIDSGLQVVETRTVEGCLRSLQDGQSDFFSATSLLPESQTHVALARLSFDSAFRVGDVVAGDVSITVTSTHRIGSSLVVVGKIKNNDTVTLADGTSCAVVRDVAGAVVMTGKLHVGDIAAGATASYTLSLTVPDDATANTVDIWVDGLHGDANGAPIAPASAVDNAVTCSAANTPSSTPTGTSTSTSTGTATPTSTPTATATHTATPDSTNTPAPTSTPC